LSPSSSLLLQTGTIAVAKKHVSDTFLLFFTSGLFAFILDDQVDDANNDAR
jgi:hypothetical protein